MGGEGDTPSGKQRDSHQPSFMAYEWGYPHLMILIHSQEEGRKKNSEIIKARRLETMAKQFISCWHGGSCTPRHISGYEQGGTRQCFKISEIEPQPRWPGVRLHSKSAERKKGKRANL